MCQLLPKFREKSDMTEKSQDSVPKMTKHKSNLLPRISTENQRELNFEKRQEKIRKVVAEMKKDLKNS